MQIAKALGIRQRDVIALVGAGGKSTLMFRLAGEFCRRRIPSRHDHHHPAGVDPADLGACLPRLRDTSEPS